mgnify:CR=1 FL=1
MFEKKKDCSTEKEDSTIWTAMITQFQRFHELQFESEQTNSHSKFSTFYLLSRSPDVEVFLLLLRSDKISKRIELSGKIPEIQAHENIVPDEKCTNINHDQDNHI